MLVCNAAGLQMPCVTFCVGGIQGTRAAIDSGPDDAITRIKRYRRDTAKALELYQAIVKAKTVRRALPGYLACVTHLAFAFRCWLLIATAAPLETAAAAGAVPSCHELYAGCNECQCRNESSYKFH